MKDVRQVARKLAESRSRHEALLYAELRLSMTYNAAERVVLVEVPLVGYSACRRRDTRTRSTANETARLAAY